MLCTVCVLYLCTVLYDSRDGAWVYDTIYWTQSTRALVDCFAFPGLDLLWSHKVMQMPACWANISNPSASLQELYMVCFLYNKCMDNPKNWPCNKSYLLRDKSAVRLQWLVPGCHVITSRMPFWVSLQGGTTVLTCNAILAPIPVSTFHNHPWHELLSCRWSCLTMKRRCFSICRLVLLPTANHLAQVLSTQMGSTPKPMFPTQPMTTVRKLLQHLPALLQQQLVEQRMSCLILKMLTHAMTWMTPFKTAAMRASCTVAKIAPHGSM